MIWHENINVQQYKGASLLRYTCISDLVLQNFNEISSLITDLRLDKKIKVYLTSESKFLALVFNGGLTTGSSAASLALSDYFL